MDDSDFALIPFRYEFAGHWLQYDDAMRPFQRLPNLLAVWEVTIKIGPGEAEHAGNIGQCTSNRLDDGVAFLRMKCDQQVARLSSPFTIHVNLMA